MDPYTYKTEPETKMRAYPIATPGQRVIALGIDLMIYALIRLIAGAILYLIGLSVLAEIIALVYLVFRDSLPFLQQQSIGKKLMKIRVLHKGSFNIDFFTDIKRNYLFLPNLLNALGFNFIYISGGITLILLIIELYLVLEKENSQRLGDRFADTSVVQE
jgi:uncharacterized RDD family membrane protein YckC